MKMRGGRSEGEGRDQKEGCEQEWGSGAVEKGE